MIRIKSGLSKRVRCEVWTRKRERKSENMGQNGYISTLSNDEECSGLSKVSRYIYVNIMRVLSSCAGLFEHKKILFILLLAFLEMPCV